MTWALAAALPVSAGEFRFEPSVRLRASYYDNVEFAEEEADSDYSVRVGLALPLQYVTPRTTFTLEYQPSYEFFNEHDQFDNFRHQGSVSLDTSPDELSRFLVSARFVRTEREFGFGTIDEIDAVDTFLLHRTERLIRQFHLLYGRRVSATWSTQFDARYRDWEFERNEDLADPNLDFRLEDRREISAGVEALHDLSATALIGVRYEARQFDLEASGEQLAQLVSLIAEREFRRNTQLRLEVGAVYLQDDLVSSTGTRIEDDRLEPQGRLTLSRSFGRSRLTLELRHRPSAGGARPGTATLSSVGLDFDRQQTRRFSWSAGVRYAHRDPSLPEQRSIDAGVIAVRVGYRFTRYIGLQTGLHYSRELDSDARDVLAFRGGLSLVWYPFRNTPLGQNGTDSQ